MKKHHLLVLAPLLLLAAAVLGSWLPFRTAVHASPDIVSLSIGINQSAPESYSGPPTLDIVFNLSGTHIDSKGYLKIRLDFYPREGDKSYDSQHVFVVDETSPEFLEGYKGELDELGSPIDQKAYDDWIASLPHIWRVNPCLCYFATVPADITTAELEAYIDQTFHADITATIDDVMSQADSSHLISPFMKNRPVLQAEKVLTPDKELLINDVNQRLAGVSIRGLGNSPPLDVESQSIDVGPGATDRANNQGGVYGFVDEGNPANANGTLDTWELWYYSNGISIKVATAYLVSGSNFTSRDSETIGSVTAGSKQTFTGLSTDVQTGDYAYVSQSSTSAIEWTGSGSPAAVCYGTNVLPFTNSSFSRLWGRACSIYATGTEAGGDPDISVSPTSYDFGVIAAGATPSTTTSYFTIDNLSTMQTDQTISVTTGTWSGGAGWTHSDTATPGADTAGLKANRGGTWGTGDIIVKNASPDYIYENCPATTDYSFGIKLWAPSSYTESNYQQKTIVVRITATAG